MRIESARWEAGELILGAPGMDARRMVAAFRPGEYEFVLKRKRRSLDANAYAWVLMDKLAAALGFSREEIYREAIRGIGGVSETVTVQKQAAQKLGELWSRNGLGWFVDTMPSNIPGCVTAVLYYGSSCYDTAQMSRLIDRLIADCKQLGIETMPPEKLQALLESWNGQ